MALEPRIVDHVGMGYVRGDRPADPREARVLRHACVALAASVVCAVWFGAGIGGDGVVRWADNLGTTLAALTATALCLRAAARRGGDERFWRMFGIACACWALAEVIWGVYDVLLRRDIPAASWADVGYLAALPFSVAALARHPAMGASPMRRARRTLDGVVIGIALLFISWTLVLQPLWASADVGRPSTLVALAYPLGDAVIIFFIVLALRAVTGPHRQAIWCLLLGLAAMALSDSAYAYLTGMRSYAPGGALDAGWIAAYLMIAVAAAASAARRGEHIRRPRFSASPLPSLVAPFVPMLVALTLAAVQMQRGRELDDVSWALALALVVLVLVRQSLVVIEAADPRTRGVGFTERLARAAVGEPVAAGIAEPHDRRREVTAR
jgi:hypothetical protein